MKPESPVYFLLRAPYFTGLVARTAYGKVINALWSKAPVNLPHAEFLREAQALWKSKYQGNAEEIDKLLQETRPTKTKFRIRIKLPQKK